MDNSIADIAKKLLIEAGYEIIDTIFVLENIVPSGRVHELIFNGPPNMVVAVRSDSIGFAEFIDSITHRRDIEANVGFSFRGHPWRAILFKELCLKAGINIYSEDGSFYDKTNELLQSDDIAFFKKYLSEHPCNNVLEIACGTNRIGKEILPYIKKYDGIDLSTVMLKYATIKTWEPYASFFCKDMRNFTLPWNYDLILCAYNSLQILDEKDVVNCLNCAASLLSKKGKMIIDIFNPKTEFITIEAVTERKCSFFSEKNSDHLIELYETHQYNPKSRINYIHYTYKDTENDQSWVGEYSMTQFDTNKMDSLIRQADLKVINKYGDYNFQPFSDACYKQIFILAPL